MDSEPMAGTMANAMLPPPPPPGSAPGSQYNTHVKDFEDNLYTARLQSRMQVTRSTSHNTPPPLLSTPSPSPESTTHLGYQGGQHGTPPPPAPLRSERLTWAIRGVSMAPRRAKPLHAPTPTERRVVGYTWQARQGSGSGVRGRGRVRGRGHFVAVAEPWMP